MRKFVLLFFSFCLVSYTYQLKPFAIEYQLLGRVAGVAFKQPTRADEVVAALKAVLNARADSHLGKLIELSGFDPGVVTQLGWSTTEVRCRAASKLAEIIVPAAEAALQNFQLERSLWARDFGVFECAQGSLIDFRVASVPSTQEKIKILEDSLDFSVHMYGIDMPIREWVGEQLCNLGALEDLPRIAQRMLEIRNDASSEEQIAYCRARMEVASRNPDRVKALATALFPNGFEGPLPSGQKPSMTLAESRADQLRGWAMWQLAGMHSAAADEVLTRYFAAVDKLDREHPLRFEAVFQLETLHEMWNAYGRQNIGRSK